MWCFAILLVLVIGVWIVASLLRGQEEQRQARPRARPRSNDLDRFLREIEARRRKSEERSPDVPNLEDPVDVVPAPPVRRPTPPPQGWVRPAPPPKPAPVAAPPPPPVVEVVQEVVRVSEPPRPSAAPLSTVLTAVQEVEIRPARPVPTARPATAPAQLLRLLRTPQSLRTAILLREVLGPPVCLRRRMRPL
jgi:hypothetical protein